MSGMNEKIDIEAFFQNQLNHWKSVSENYVHLKHIQCRNIDYNGFKIEIQFNPERIRSSAANIEKKVIDERPCFLCPQNRPLEQMEIDYLGRYDLLVNPYPIFPKHLTIPDKQHLPQLIKGRIGDMLQLAKDLPDYTILYNGPKSGASAPDHFHFQAGNKGLLPIEKDVHSGSYKVKIKENKEGSLYQMQNYLRNCFIFESKDLDWLRSEFEEYYLFQHKLQPEEDEPMFNVICWQEENVWQLVIFPRKQHRPYQYYETGINQILLSPGVVDFGGILVVPRKEDYDKLNKDLVKDIYSQLTLNFYETT